MPFPRFSPNTSQPHFLFTHQTVLDGFHPQKRVFLVDSQLFRQPINGVGLLIYLTIEISTPQETINECFQFFVVHLVDIVQGGEVFTHLFGTTSLDTSSRESQQTMCPCLHRLVAQPVVVIHHPLQQRVTSHILLHVRGPIIVTRQIVLRQHLCLQQSIIHAVRLGEE